MIKLAKVGKTNKKLFRIIVSEKARDPYGKALEILGSYNQYEKNLQINGERVKHWISQGAQMTKSINNLLVANKIVEGEKVKNSRPGTPNKIKQAKLEKAKEKEVAKAQEAAAAKEEKVETEVKE